mmetsp:Transcript_14122/g.48593  ORF Transcript_14122/g.48593 Transcript_14122/m.48593 type:complete len:274 (+) Transcript_14122:175-996(+)
MGGLLRFFLRFLLRLLLRDLGLRVREHLRPRLAFVVLHRTEDLDDLHVRLRLPADHLVHGRFGAAIVECFLQVQRGFGCSRVVSPRRHGAVRRVLLEEIRRRREILEFKMFRSGLSRPLAPVLILQSNRDRPAVQTKRLASLVSGLVLVAAVHLLDARPALLPEHVAVPRPTDARLEASLGRVRDVVEGHFVVFVEVAAGLLDDLEDPRPSRRRVGVGGDVVVLGVLHEGLQPRFLVDPRRLRLLEPGHVEAPFDGRHYDVEHVRVDDRFLRR